MRAWNLVCEETRFLRKYGILGLYAVFSLLYFFILSLLPAGAKQIGAAILIFTDPAAMGLFFMGAVVLLEKSQRVNCSLAVAPITLSEYIFAKALPMMAAGLVVGVFLGVCGGLSIGGVAVGTALASLVFSLCGLFVAVKAETLNGFVLATVPFELVLCLPALLDLFGVIGGKEWLLHPGVAALRLISGQAGFWAVCSLVFWLGMAFLLCRRAVRRYFDEMGGGRL